MAKNAPKQKQAATKRAAKKSARENTRGKKVVEIYPGATSEPATPAKQNRNGSVKPFAPITKPQGNYLQSIEANTLTIGDGPAGTGKTYVAMCHAAKLLQEKRIRQIRLVRPAVEAGGGIGFLPGELEDKLAPYMVPFMDILRERLGDGVVECALKNGNIVIEALEHMRGRTFENEFVILDEAQNATKAQVKTFLTRIGKFCTVVVNGDSDQCDLKNKADSGLPELLELLHDMPDVGIVTFTEEDIVRSGIVKAILLRYRAKAVLEKAEQLQKLGHKTPR